MNTRHEAWVVDDDASIRWVLEQALDDAGITVRSFEDANTARRALTKAVPDVLLTDVRMPGEDGMALLAYLRARHPGTPVIVMTAHSDLDSAIGAHAGGAYEYLPKPFDIDAAVALVRRAAGQSVATHSVAPTGGVPEQEIIGAAPAMQEVFRAIGRLSRSDATVLISGESGTGKERVAMALHRHSPRAARKLVTLNAAAIPHELLEAELFGHERGAFTGAAAQRIGRFEEADGGTLFLDEIGDMPHAAQTRLLRVLEDGRFYRVGGTRTITVDVRVIAATNQALEARVETGEFREDLYHRLNVVRVHVPPLRERSRDIPALAAYFLRQAAQEMGVGVKHPTPGTLERLSAYAWPGNVRQLRNLCTWLTVMAPGEDIHPSDLPPEMGGAPGTTVPAWQQHLAAWAEDRLAKGGDGLVDAALPAFERTLIEAALRHADGQRGEAAKLLGWGRNTLTRKLKGRC